MLKSLNNQENLHKAIKACRLGREVLLKYFGHLEHVEEKVQAGLVSEADKESEAVIQAELRKYFPDMDFLGEESAYESTTKVRTPATDKARWILDPLDGTTNYVHRFPIYCISLALEYQGQIQLAVIDVPMMNETYTAIRGQGAFVNGKKMRVSSTDNLKDSLLATGFFADNAPALEEQLKIFSSLVKRSRGVRRPGAAAYDLCMVARGVFDAFWEKNLSPWDTAAGVLLVEEAGGQVVTKSDAVIKLLLVFVISLLSFAVGTFVGKKYSDKQHKELAYEPTGKDTHGREVASEHEDKASSMTKEEAAKFAQLADEFELDDTQETTVAKIGEQDSHETAPTGHEGATPSGHGEKVAPAAAPAPAHGNSQGGHGATAGAQPLKAAQNILEGKPAVEPVKPAQQDHRIPAALPTNVAQYPAGKFTVQVASFSTELDAKKRAEELKGKGYSAFYIPAKVNGQTWYRVSVGQFPTEQEAKSYRSEFMSKTKIESAIIQKNVN